MKKALLIILFPLSVFAQWTVQKSNTTASFRAVFAVSEKVIWIGGTKGTVLKTTDGGINWQNVSVQNAEKLDFRGIVAFSENEAVVSSAGLAEEGQAKIFKTTDGGKTWQLVYESNQKGVFLDGISFWNKNEGLVFGDPIDQKWFLLKTIDGGKSWEKLNSDGFPVLQDGEAAFAASNSSMFLQSPHHAWIASGGGKNARIFYSKNAGITWDVKDVPMLASTTAGLFGIKLSKKISIAVGGDYKQETSGNTNVLISRNQGKLWEEQTLQPAGLREAIGFLKDGKIILIGPQGSNISTDNGHSWQSTDSPKGIHAMSCFGNSCWTVGGKGLIAKYN